MPCGGQGRGTGAAGTPGRSRSSWAARKPWAAGQAAFFLRKQGHTYHRRVRVRVRPGKRAVSNTWETSFLDAERRKIKRPLPVVSILCRLPRLGQRPKRNILFCKEGIAYEGAECAKNCSTLF